MPEVERKILLNPGPATTTQRVKDALVIEDICPREQRFGELYADVRSRLALLAGAEPETVAIPIVGSGTTALEASLVSFVCEGDAVLIVENGDYGKRLAKIAAAQGIRHQVLELGFGQPIDLTKLEAALEAGQGELTHLYFVHHETSSGLITPIEPVVALARRYGVTILLDAMSSYGCLPISVGPDGVDALVSSSNKCVQGMAGLGIVVARRALLDAARPKARRCFALDLIAEFDHLESTGQSRFTVPPQVISALHEALLELEEEGLAGREARYMESMRTLMAGLRALSFEFLLEDAQQSGILVAVKEPDAPWYDFDAMHAALDREGFTIYPGKPGAVPTFRLAVLGAIDSSDIEAFLKAFGRYLTQVRG
jgi:2-aminoethylphosphonate-pyruvate transaminase